MMNKVTLMHCEGVGDEMGGVKAESKLSHSNRHRVPCVHLVSRCTVVTGENWHRLYLAPGVGWTLGDRCEGGVRN